MSDSVDEHTQSGTVLLVDDDPALAEGHARSLSKSGFEVSTVDSGEKALEAIEQLQQAHCVVLDLLMPGIGGMETLKRIREMDPDLPVVVVSGQQKVSTAIEALREGAYDYLIKPVVPETLSATVRHAVNQRLTSLELVRLRESVRQAHAFDRLIGRSDVMLRIFKLIERTLHNDITVLILGESGTGKELVARAIHFNGQRGDKPFVVVNCAAIPRELVESELFGHEKGSFTGALERKIGKFELASGGTLFLDEIGELEQSVQAKLLRALQEREIERVGGNKTIPVNVRLVCATQRDLDLEVKEGRFREDLYYRINTYPIVMPPLRERDGDVELLAGHLLDKHARHLGRTDIRGFSPAMVEALRSYDWPGNVRQLENVISRAMVLAESDVLTLAELPENILSELPEELRESEQHEAVELQPYETSQSPSYIVDPAVGNAPAASVGGWPHFRSADEVPSLEEVKEWAVREAYAACKGNISLAAKKLGLGRATLYRMLDKYEISTDEEE